MPHITPGNFKCRYRFDTVDIKDIDTYRYTNATIYYF